MLIDINPSMELPSYKVVLCKLNKEEITELHTIAKKVYTNMYATIDEFTFSIPMMLSENGRSIRNPIYDLVETDHLIFVNDKQYFHIDSVNEIESQDGVTNKEVHTYSLEYELGNKNITNYDRVGRRLYTGTELDSKDEDGFYIGILNHIETMTSWKIGRVDSSLMDDRRMLSFSSSNLLQVFEELSKTYNCLFTFDTINQTINASSIDNLGENKGLYISDTNFIKNISKNTNSGELKTRLIVKGKDDVSIHGLSVTGRPYIENYSFYKNEKYMSKGLIDGLDRYEAFLKTKESQFNGHLKNLNSIDIVIDGLKNELATLNTQLKTIQNDIDIRITLNAENVGEDDSSGGSQTGAKSDLSDLKQLESNKLSQIKSKQSQIDSQHASKKAIQDNISKLQKETTLNNFITDSELMEFDRFVREDTFLDTNYTEENVDELLANAKKMLAKISQPKVTFDVDVFDFLSLVEYQHMWKSFISGDIVNLVHEGINIDWQVRLIGYTHDVDSHGLNLQFSNKDSIDDANMYIADLIDNMNTVSTNVDFNKYKWDKAELAESTIASYIDSELELSKQAILTAEGQKPILDDRGFWLYKEENDGSINNEQMRLINNTLAITEDNWNTVSTAVSGKGINANIIRGKLGQFAKIDAHQVDVIGGGNIKDYTDARTDEIIGNLGYKDYQDMVDEASKGNTIIKGGYIRTGLVTADNIVTGTLNASKVGIGGANGVTIDANGLTSMGNGGRTITRLNSSQGISIQNRVGQTWRNSFYVDTNGRIQASHITIDGDGKFKGRVEADSGYFKGELQAASGSFDGILTARDIILNGRSILTNWKTQIDGNAIDELSVGKLHARYGKISTALIENLVVGNNVTMGSNAKISWGNVTNQPNIPSESDITTITRNTIQTGYLTTNISQVNNSLRIGAQNQAGTINLYGSGSGNGAVITSLSDSSLQIISWSGDLDLRAWGNINLSARQVRIGGSNVATSSDIDTVNGSMGYIRDDISRLLRRANDLESDVSRLERNLPDSPVETWYGEKIYLDASQYGITIRDSRGNSMGSLFWE